MDHALPKKRQEAQDLMPDGQIFFQKVLAKSLVVLIEEQMRVNVKQVAEPRKRAAFPRKKNRHIPSAVKWEVALYAHFKFCFVGK